MIFSILFKAFSYLMYLNFLNRENSLRRDNLGYSSISADLHYEEIQEMKDKLKEKFDSMENLRNQIDLHLGQIKEKELKIIR